MTAVFEERKIEFELKISMKEIMFLGHKCVFIKHLTYIFKNSFWKTDLFALYIETCFLACLCLSSFAPRDVRGELFSDCEIAREILFCSRGRERHAGRTATGGLQDPTDHG